MQDGLVADRAIAPDRQWRPHVGVKHAAVRDVAAFADMDELIVAAQHRAEPDTDIAVKLHLADHNRIGRDPIFILGRKLRKDTVKRIDRHAPLFLRGSLMNYTGTDPTCQSGLHLSR